MVERWISKYDVLKAFIVGTMVSNPNGFESSFPGILWLYGQPFALRINDKLIIVKDISTLSQGQALIRNTLVSLANREFIETMSLGSDFSGMSKQFQYGNIKTRKDVLVELV